ncbi:MAG: hypothetical protein EP298_11370 [Gammaproteobacteria bacterium]|nr:MAG: hypothetical protein EP298_11370 [Gammaproteobacteria bacterium]UTW43218.1 hypothetical protein KFE69_03475 [bacterium SCSIO 12844]
MDIHKKIKHWETIYSNSILFSKLAKDAIKYSAPIKDFFDKSVPTYQLSNFSFVRTRNDNQRSIITLKPLLAKKFYNKNLHTNDLMLDRDNIYPLYNRKDLLNRKQLETYKSINKELSMFEPIIIEHDLGIAKDSFCFLIKLSDDKQIDNIVMLYNLLYKVILTFYKLYQPPLTKIFPSYEITYNQRLETPNYAPFSQIVLDFNLTANELNYIKLLTHNMNTNQIATLLSKSPRTVEKAIDRIKIKSSFSSKIELENYLQTHYLDYTYNYLISNDTLKYNSYQEVA